MANGWWDNNGAISGCLAAWQPIGAESLAASYTNLANPGTYDAAPGTAPTFTASTGWTFDGSTQYLNTGLTPGAGSSCIARITVTSSHNGVAVGHFLSWGVGYWGGGSGPIYIAGNFRFGATPGGFPFNTVLAHNSTQGYRDAAADGSFLTAGAAGAAISLGSGGTTNAPFNGKIQAAAVYSGALTGAQITTLTTLMNALPVATGQPAAVRGVLIPGMNRDGRRIGASRIGWG